MILPWPPVVIMDIIGSIISLGLALHCVRLTLRWPPDRRNDFLRDCMVLLTISLTAFVCARSTGHLLKHLLRYLALPEVWQKIMPVSGAIDSITFVAIFCFCIYFQRVNAIYLKLENYKKNLEELITLRTAELNEINYSLQEENRNRQQFEAELTQSKTKLENILNSASPLCITDLNFNLIEANAAYLEIWPRKSKTITDLKCYNSRPGNRCHTTECPLNLIVAGEDEVICEAIKLLDNNQHEDFIQTTRPFRNNKGELIGVVSTFQEITEQKKVERALAAEREHLAVTLRSIGDGVISTDIEGRVKMLNKVAEKLCGWSQQEAVDRLLPEIFQLVDERTGLPCENPVDKVLATGDIIFLSDHTMLIAKDGTQRAIADSGAPIRDPESKIIGVVLVIRDVTEKKQMEQEILKIKKLESVGLLAGGIAHDFNNILTSILGNINLAKELFGKNHDAVPLLEDAEKASMRAKDLTRQLLTFAKGGAPVKETASIATVIRDSVSFILRGSNTNCTFDIPDDLWLVDIDQGQMSQVIQNIILNSRQAMPAGGQVRISCRNLNYPASGNKCIKIIISDSGSGIAPDIIDKIFDPYFTTSPEGSGLGLAICHSIVTKHDGRIEVQSRPGIGTTFIITLPASTIDTPREKASQHPVSVTNYARILLMDDEYMVSNIAKQMLTHLGHEVVTVDDGQKAIATYKQALAEENRFDLVIMDLTIPGGMGGKEAVTHVLALNPQAKVIVVSGYSNDPVMADYKSYGFSGFLYKPFDLEELNTVTQKVLD